MADYKAKAIKNLTPSYSQQWDELSTPREVSQPQGAVDLGTAAHIRELASLEAPDHSITGPVLGGSKKGGGASAPQRTHAAPAARQMSLEEQIAALMAQQAAQQQALQAAPTAVNVQADQFANTDPYAGLGDVNDLQMGDPRLARR